MVEVIIGTHKFEVASNMWVLMQAKLNKIHEQGHTEFGFIDIHGIYRDIRINNATIIVCNYGKAPTHMYDQLGIKK